MPRDELAELVGKEVIIECLTEAIGESRRGPVRCIKEVRVLAAENHQLVEKTQLNHVWVQAPVNEVVLNAPKGVKVKAIARVKSYIKKGGQLDYTVQELRLARIVN